MIFVDGCVPTFIDETMYISCMCLVRTQGTQTLGLLMSSSTQTLAEDVVDHAEDETMPDVADDDNTPVHEEAAVHEEATEPPAPEAELPSQQPQPEEPHQPPAREQFPAAVPSGSSQRQFPALDAGSLATTADSIPVSVPHSLSKFDLQLFLSHKQRSYRIVGHFIQNCWALHIQNCWALHTNLMGKM